MSALTQPRMGKEGCWKNIPLVLAASTVVYAGGIAVLDPTNGVGTKGVAGTSTFIRVGEFIESIDNSASTATSYVMVSLDREITLRWYDNVTGGNAVTAANLYNTCYILDDHTVTMASSGNSPAGRVWQLDPIFGVAVQETNT